MTYESTLRYKQTVVQEALRHIGGQKQIEVKPTIGMQEPQHYRNKVEYAVDAKGRLGFAMAGSHVIIPAAACPLAEEKIVSTAKIVEQWLMGAGAGSKLRWVVLRVTSAGEVMLILSGERVANRQTLCTMLPESVKSVQHCRLKARPAHALDGDVKLLWGEQRLMEELAGMRFGLSAQSFFQVNRSQCEKLLALAI